LAAWGVEQRPGKSRLDPAHLNHETAQTLSGLVGGFAHSSSSIMPLDEHELAWVQEDFFDQLRAGSFGNGLMCATLSLPQFHLKRE